MDALFEIANERGIWRRLPSAFGPRHTIDMQRDCLPGLQREALSLDGTMIKLHADGADAPRTRSARRSAARAACPGLEPG